MLEGCGDLEHWMHSGFIAHNTIHRGAYNNNKDCYFVVDDSFPVLLLENDKEKFLKLGFICKILILFQN